MPKVKIRRLQNVVSYMLGDLLVDERSSVLLGVAAVQLAITQQKLRLTGC